tara:strand:+ start:189 stop:1937 length:1749 start_codon:yes stop_codon:yes gene_type:complete
VAREDNMFYMGNRNLPNVNWKGEYTKQQVRDLKKASSNILYFAENFFHIINLDRGKEKIKLYKPQKRALRKMRDTRFFCLLASRQIGKSTMMTIYILWQACFNNDQRILLVANKEATAIEIFQRVRMAYEELPNWLKPPVKEYAKTSMTLENGSRIGITTTTGTAARGQSVNCLVIDEMAFIESHLVDEFWKSVFPIITSSKKSKVFVCSTANGTDNLFYKLYTGAVEGTNSWDHDKIKWNEIPGRDEAWAKDTKTALGSADAWLQEFECEFIHSGESTLDDELFEEMMQKVSKPKIVLDEGHYKIWEEPDDTKLYVAGVDISEGVGVDASVIQILDITDLRDIKQVAVYRNNTIPPLEFTNRVYKILRNWGSPLALIERNNCGAQVVDRLATDLGYEKIVSYGNANAHRRNVMRGMIAHTNTKYKGVLNMRYFMNEVRTVHINEEETVMELRNFVRYPNGTWKARAGFHDDRVMAILYSLFILEKEITERFFEIVEEDDMGKPVVIEPMDFGIEYFEDPTSIYLDEEIVGGNSNDLPAIVWGMGDEQNADMDELQEFGFQLLGETPPDNWTGQPVDYRRDY